MVVGTLSAEGESREEQDLVLDLMEVLGLEVLVLVLGEGLIMVEGDLEVLIMEEVAVTALS